MERVHVVRRSQHLFGGPGALCVSGHLMRIGRIRRILRTLASFRAVPAVKESREPMGDAGEGLIDADARIQERMEELQVARAQGRRPAVRNPEQVRAVAPAPIAGKESS